MEISYGPPEAHHNDRILFILAWFVSSRIRRLFPIEKK